MAPEKRKSEDEAKISRKTRRRNPKPVGDNFAQFVKWEQLAQSRWGQDLLNKHVTEQELDDLVEWATHIDQGSSENPLIGLDGPPLHPSILDYLYAQTNDLAKSRGVGEVFNLSALIAVGMMVEEMITLSLLPIAQAHVNRCRAIEENGGDAFEDWTLPPEEAIALLSADGTTTGGFSTSHPATHAPEEKINTVRGFKQADIVDPGKSSRIYCAQRDLDPNFVLENWDTYKMIVGNPPSTSNE